MFTVARPIPEQYRVVHLNDEGKRSTKIRKKGNSLNVFTVNYCDTCHCVKPLRTHHCKMCRRCILRMDHHCPLLQVSHIRCCRSNVKKNWEKGL
ncbi:DHHC zinc finger domain protein [Oesophagostomum dentatum]|uniref:Palmitoyltransferase n=1 Tax=Oesophagostomum dentatum TaxID=61180 RepID=A0A0B1TD98_OESDE|nr:DHHC zinc finger domain protein [Oesophagostomum dentatum]